MSIKEYRVRPGAGVSALVPSAAQSRELVGDEVRVAIKAVALNARDAAIVAGQYPVPHTRPLVPCSDGAGEVLELGPEANVFSIGERVVSCFFRDWVSGSATKDSIAVSHGCEIDGMLATEAVVSARALARIPESIDFADAACAPCAGTTAWNALFEFGRLPPGRTVVVQGTGGVALWAMQLASAAGLDCIVTSSSDRKLEQLPTRDAAIKCVNYTSHEQWASEILRLTGGQGADLVLELAGRETVGESLNAACVGGKIAVIGGLSGWAYEGFNSLAAVVKQLTLRGIYVGSREMLESLLKFMAAQRLRPMIAERIPFDSASAAFAAMVAPDRVGKIVITM
jgi:NADPH:quinone reductase-like Zn-dependent oxidoreductase